MPGCGCRLAGREGVAAARCGGGGGGLPFSTRKGQTAGADDHKEVLVEYNGDGPAGRPKAAARGPLSQNPSASSAGGRRPKPPSAEGLVGGGGLRRGSGAQGEVCGRELVVDAAPFGLVVRRAGSGASSEVGLIAARWCGLRRPCAGGVGRGVDGEDGELTRGVRARGQSCWEQRRGVPCFSWPRKLAGACSSGELKQPRVWRRWRRPGPWQRSG